MKYIITFFIEVLIGTNFLVAQTPVIQYKQLATGLTNPVDIAAPADGSGRLFILEQNGTVSIANGSKVKKIV